MKGTPAGSRGFTLIEAMIGLVVGALVMAGAWRVWKTQHEESFRLRKKTELRDRMALSSKQIQRSITLAGIGLSRAPTLVKADALGSDTLTIYTNEGETRTGSLSNLMVGQYAIHVQNPGALAGALYLAITDGTRGEVKPIERLHGNVVVLRGPLESSYPMAAVSLLPAKREKYWTDQGGSRLIRSVNASVHVLSEDVRNFQVSFRDKSGASTEVPREVRSVHFSFTGVFPAKEGMINSLNFTSTAIPRNLL